MFVETDLSEDRNVTSCPRAVLGIDECYQEIVGDSIIPNEAGIPLLRKTSVDDALIVTRSRKTLGWSNVAAACRSASYSEHGKIL